MADLPADGPKVDPGLAADFLALGFCHFQVELLTRHLETCVLGRGGDSAHESAKPMTQQELLDEVKTALSRFLK